MNSSGIVSEVRRYGRMQVAQHGKEHRALALWAARCAAHVLPYFEKRHPKDRRPRQALEVAHAYARGEIVFSMRMVRTASLAAHAAARATVDPAARAAARAAGQAVATLHVPRHACGAAAYAVVAVAAHVTPDRARAAAARERAWQARRLPKSLRRVVYANRARPSI